MRRSWAANIIEGDLIMIEADTFQVIGPLMRDALGLVLAYEAVTILADRPYIKITLSRKLVVNR
jgi:hypothetical protein